MRLPALLCLLAAGCTPGRDTLAPGQPSPVRTSLADSIRALAEARMAGDGWAGEVLDITRGGQSAGNRDEAWDETTLRVVFAPRGEDGEPRRLTQPEMASLLQGLRADVRKLVTRAGGDNQDSADGEAFRERWVHLPYRVGDTSGWVRATVGPASHKDEETHNRLELVVREGPAR